MPSPYQWTSILEVLNEMEPSQLVTRQNFERRTRTREWEWAVAQRAPTAISDAHPGSPFLTFADGARVNVARLVLAEWVGEFSLAHMHANDVLRLRDTPERRARSLMWSTLFETLMADPNSWSATARTLNGLRPLIDDDEEIFDMPF